MIRTLTILFLTVAMAQAALTEFYVQTTGDNLNAGSTTSDTPTFSAAGGDWNGTVWTKAGADLSGVSIGMWASVHPDSTTTTTPFVARITGVDDGADTITVSATVKSGTAPSTSTSDDVSIKVGGAWEGPSGTTGFPWGFMQNTAIDNAGEKPIVYFKAGTYAVTGSLGTHANAGILWEGYQTTPGDWATASAMPIIDGTGGAMGTPFIVLTQDGDGNMFRFFHFRGNVTPGTMPSGAGTGNAIIDSTANNCLYERMLFTGSWRAGLKIDASGSVVVECEAWDNNMDDASDFAGFWSIGPSTFIRCKSYRNNALGAGGDNLGFNFNPGTGEIITALWCTSDSNSKHGFQAQGSSGSVVLIGCASINNTDSGYYSNGTGSSLWYIENSVAYNNSDYAFFRSTAADGATRIRNNAVGASGVATSLNINSDFITDTITLSADPFEGTDGDFSLNDDAGGGELLKGTGWGLYPDYGDYSESFTSTPNVGPYQAAGSGGSGGGGTRAYIIIQ